MLSFLPETLLFSVVIATGQGELAFGEGKSDAIAGAVEGPVTASNPASILQMHPEAKFYLDGGSASKLRRADYYRWVFERKPAWQVDA